VPDTLIARKHGQIAAEWVAAQARRVLALGGPATSRGAAALGQLDRFLRDDRNSWNPGTSADLVAAGLFVVMLEYG
jgi:triphosphoribosyl-dephospho-CoA synthase